MIDNLPEEFLYERLPEGLVDLDQRGLIQAVVGGYQDRIEDLRSYSRKLELLFQTEGLPETGNNVVLVDIQSDQGKVYTRSLDINDDTPADGTSALTTWVLNQLVTTDESRVSNIRYGRDLLRLVDANTLDYLAATIGAVLFQSSALTTVEQSAANHQILQTYFPRLKIKGTADSFTALGRILGFDDVKLTPLWGRVSPRVPNDIGNPQNNADFSSDPEYQPQQAIDDFYNPLKTNDGPFFSWSGTVSPGTGATDFCTQVVNGFNPWVDVSLLRVNNGTVTYPAAGSYALGSSGSNSIGGPHKKAYVEAGDVLFRALGEGQYFNGIEIHVVDSGTNKVLTITDRLSAIKYRSSYFDLALTAEFDRVEELFGQSAMRRNKDLAANPALTSDGTAQSPYRPWWAGSLYAGTHKKDFLVMSGTEVQSVIKSRVQASGTDRQLNVDELMSAGIQVVQALEEVRPATRLPRRTGVGFLLRDEVGYAAYLKETPLFFAGTFTPFILNASYFGSISPDTPTAPYHVLVRMEVGSITVYPEIVEDPLNSNGYLYAAPGVQGSWDFTTGSYNFTFFPQPNWFNGTQVYALWKPISTEVIRNEPAVRSDIVEDTVVGVKEFSTEKAYQGRPEDQDDGTHTYEVADDMPWRRDLVLGGEVVDVATYSPIEPDAEYQPVDPVMAIPGHDGANYDVFGIGSPSGILRLITSPRSLGDDYKQGMPAVAYKGALNDLASVSPAHGLTELERLFSPGAKLYTVGNVQGVLVADPNKFYSDAHRTRLVAWFPFNEHVDSDLPPLDHSVCQSNLTPINLSADSRVWDDNRGWYLKANLGAVLLSQKLRFTGDQFSLSFWFKKGTESGTFDLITYGPIKVQWNSVTSLLTFFDGISPIGSVMAESDFTFASIVITTNNAVIGHGDLNTAITTVDVPGSYSQFGELDDMLVINGCGSGLSDLRIWSSYKSSAQMESIRDYAPTDTKAGYPIGSFLALNKQDRYGLKVLPNGLVAAAPLPAFYNVPRLARAIRYDSLGLYQGESRFKEVGLGGGQLLPNNFKLGQQFYDMSATGDIVVSTTTGVEPGYTEAWGSWMTNYLRVVQTSSHSFDQYLMTGTDTPWPNPMEATNTANDAVWVKGDDGFIYELFLVSSGTGAKVEAKRVVRDRTDAELEVSGFSPSFWGALRVSEQPTGPQTILVSNGSRLAVAGNGSVVYQKSEPVASAGAVSTAFNYNSFIKWIVPDGYQVDLIGHGFFDFFPTEGIYVDMVGTPLLGKLVSRNTFTLETTGSYKLTLGLAGNQRVSGSVFTIAAGVFPDLTTYNISGQFDPLTLHEQYITVASTRTGTISIEQTQGYSVGGTGIGNILTYVKFENVAAGVVLLEDNFDNEIVHTLETNPLYFNLNQRTVVDLPNAYDAWTDPSAFGDSQTPPVAALQGNGQLEFETTGVIVPGNYRLTVVSGNIGKVDPDFDGFEVEIAVDATILQKRLCSGFTGFNFTGTDIFNFEIDNGVSGVFLVSFDWTNGFRDASRGEARQLAIHRLKLERLVTEVYKVDIAVPPGTQVVVVNGGTYTQPAVTKFDTGTFAGTTPGGWIASMNSYGSVAEWNHESSVYPSNDTLTSKFPLSEILTANTAARREDILGPTNVVLVDATPGTIPSFGTIIES
jgi:hypothetical protein